MSTTSDVSAKLPQRAKGISTSNLLIALDDVRDDIRDSLFTTFGESFQEEYRFTPIVIGAPTVILAGTAGNVDDGTYRYRVSFVTPEQEILMGDISEKITIVDNASDGQVDLTEIPVGASGVGVTERKVYRQQNGEGDYNLVGTISDNTTTTLTDNVAQSTVGAAADGKWGFTLPDDFYYAIVVKDGSRKVPLLKRSQVRNEAGDDGINAYVDKVYGARPSSRYYVWIDYNDLTVNFPRNHSFSNELNMIYRPIIEDATEGDLPYPTHLQSRMIKLLALGAAYFYLVDNKSGEGEMIVRLQSRYEDAKSNLFTGRVGTSY